MKVNPISKINFAHPVRNDGDVTAKQAYMTSLKADSVSFGAAKVTAKPVKTAFKIAKFVAESLSTSTSGHRAPYMSEKFNPDIVKLITLGVAGVAASIAALRGEKPTVMIGGDTRKATRESLPLIEDTLLKQGVNVLSIVQPVPTPLLAMAARDYNVDLAVLMTASHNPWNDGGYNLVTKSGAIAPAEVTQNVAKFIEKYAKEGVYTENKENIGTKTTLYPYELYKNRINEHGLIDWNKIQNAGLTVFYDGLNGTGSYVMPKLLDDYKIPYEEVKSSGQEGPNPVSKNLKVLKNKIKDAKGDLKVGISNDGDADRFGVVDEKGNFINANDVILLTAYHLAKNKGLRGSIIRSQGTSMQVDCIADKYNLGMIETPVGFKFIGEDIIDLRKDGKDILVAGEESGGLTVNGHIPEKDGILAVSLILDLVATEKKPLSEILADVKAGLGKSFVLDNFSQRLTDDEAKNAMMAKFKSVYDDAINGKVDFGKDHKIDAEKTLKHQKEMEHYKKGGDGVKLLLTDGSSVLVRKSGTEPLVKFYIEAVGKTPQEAEANKCSIREQVNKIFEG